MNIQQFYRLSFLQPLLLLLFVFLIGPAANGQQLFINEFMASNNTTITDEFGGFDDWVEIYNPGPASVDIGGMYVSDDLLDLTAWQIPTTNPALTTIPAGGFLLIWFDGEPTQGELHVDPKLGAGGEDVVLTGTNGTTIIDSRTFGQQLSDVSEGREGDGNPNWNLFSEPTPGTTNNTTPGAPQTDPPAVNLIGGLYSGSVTVTATAPEGDIHYTTDGSIPTTSSALYTGPLTFSENTPLRLRAFDPPALPSNVVTNTYLIDISHTFPIVSYVADPVELFDPVIGMYPNFTEDIEINANAEMWEPDGSFAFNVLFESELHGTGSAVLEQKPLALKCKPSLGNAFVPYDVFPSQPGFNPVSLLLRNSGQDWTVTMFRDAMVGSLARDLTDVGNEIIKPKLYMQDFRPGIAFINGEYWGINNIRERMDKRYILGHFGLDDDEIDFLENFDEAKEGDFVEWDILTDFLENNSLTSEANYQFVDDRVELDHYLDYIVFNVYIDNQDWPGNNNKRWRERVPDSQWRFMTWDLDFTYGLFIPNMPWNSGYAQSNSLSRLYDENNILWPNPAWSTLLFRKLVENDNWRRDFINRMADQLNVLYDPARVNARIDEFVAAYQPEIQQHIDLWHSGFLNWDANVQILRDFANARVTPVRNHFIQQFSELTGNSNVTVNLNSSNNGEVDLSTITVSDLNEPFTGTYFRGNEIPITAFPDRGYVLQSWSGGLSGNDPKESFVLNGTTNITANFAFGSTSTQPIVINEINYNSPDNAESGDWVELHNPNGSTVDISGWYFEDESGNFFGIPANTTIAAGGFLLLIEDEDLFNNIYPSVTNYIGEFGLDPRGFGLSGGGEQITLKNANDVLIDIVDYDDNSPWPTSPDGNGPTLQLIDPGLNNALASSWEGKAATPGLPNNTPCIDNDSDGICAANDCDDNDPSVPTTPGTACDDGDPNTTNDVIQADGCTCAGTPPTGDPCDNVTVTGSSNSVTIDNIVAGHYIIKLFSPNWSQTIINCTDCPLPQTATGLSEGIYHYDVQLYSSNWQFICSVAGDVEVGGTGCTDNDNDGFCEADDCDDNDPSVPTTPGTACDDGDPNTTNDIIQADGCTCAGTPPTGDPCDDVTVSGTSNSVTIDNIVAGHYIIKLFSPNWSQTIINCTDCPLPQTATGLSEGTYHYDVQLYSSNWQFICSVAGDVEVGGTGCTDNDNDGFCEADDCDDNDPSIPTTPGTACDDGDPNTTNDVIQADGCTCVGTPPTGDPCDDVTVSGTSNSVTIDNIVAGHYIIKLFSPNWSQTIINCTDCPLPQTASGLSAGTYHYDVQLYSSNWQFICSTAGDVEVGGTGCTDNDGDGFCVADDCDDNDPSVPTTPGAACDDGDPNTTNDVIQADGCTCVGTPVGGGNDLGCGVTYSTTTTSITIDGLSTAAHVNFLLFNDSWQTQYSCFDNCNDPETFTNLATGVYILRLKVWDANWSVLCDVTEFVDLANPTPLQGQEGSAILFFNATKNGRAVNLNWVANNSEATSHFVLEESVDGDSFYELAVVDPHPANAGEEAYYQFDDKEVVVGDNFYQIRQVFNDGTERQSTVHKIWFDLDLDSFDLFPNPATSRLFVNLVPFAGAVGEIVVYNQLGQALRIIELEEVPADPVAISLDGLKGGMYHLSVKLEGRKWMTRKFVIAK